MSLELDGVWKAGVWATTVWAAGVWREGATSTKIGGDDVPRRKSPHRGFDLERWKAAQPDFEATLRDTFSALTRGPMQEQAREIVEPYIQTNQPEIDWATLARDTEAVEELMRLREEEEVVMIFLLH